MLPGALTPTPLKPIPQINGFPSFPPQLPPQPIPTLDHQSWHLSASLSPVQAFPLGSTKASMEGRRKIRFTVPVYSQHPPSSCTEDRILTLAPPGPVLEARVLGSWWPLGELCSLSFGAQVFPGPRREEAESQTNAGQTKKMQTGWYYHVNGFSPAAS